MPDTHREAASVVSSEDVEGVQVYDLGGKKVGKIDHLLVEKASGQVVAVVLSVRGFLGLGHSHARLPWSALKYSGKLNAYATDQPPEFG